MTLEEAVQSWVDIEAGVALVLYRHGIPIERVARLYDALRDGTTPERVTATRRLHHLMEAARAGRRPSESSMPPAPVDPDIWDWGRPGTREDVELLGAA